MSRPTTSAFGKILSNIKRIDMESTYLPRDLNDLWNSTQKRKRFMDTEVKVDTIKNFAVDLRKEYRNVDLLNRFVTKMGMIKKRQDTKLSAKNQMQVAKAIRRARSMGLMAFTYRSNYRSRGEV